MLTENTRNAFLCIELVDNSRMVDFKNALNELANLVEEYLGGIYRISILDINNKEVSIG
jgi:DNA/RNA-binding domain of Phe-tRNA-synthetase-like protein